MNIKLRFLPICFPFSKNTSLSLRLTKSFNPPIQREHQNSIQIIDKQDTKITLDGCSCNGGIQQILKVLPQFGLRDGSLSSALRNLPSISKENQPRQPVDFVLLYQLGIRVMINLHDLYSVLVFLQLFANISTKQTGSLEIGLKISNLGSPFNNRRNQPARPAPVRDKLHKNRNIRL